MLELFESILFRLIAPRGSFVYPMHRSLDCEDDLDVVLRFDGRLDVNELTLVIVSSIFIIDMLIRVAVP